MWSAPQTIRNFNRLCLWAGLCVCWACAPSPGLEEQSQPSTEQDVTEQAEQASGAGACGSIESLGTVATDAAGNTAELNLDVPTGAQALIITARGPDDVYVNVSAFERSDGLSLVPKAWMAIAGQPLACIGGCVNRVIAQAGEAAFMFPNTPLAKLKSGVARFRLRAFRRQPGPKYIPVDTTLAVAVHVRCVTATKSAALALNVCATGAAGLGKSNVLKDARVKKAMNKVVEIYAQADLKIGPVRACDAAKIPLVANKVGTDEELTKLFRSVQAGPMAVNVFLVDKILGASGAGPGENLLAGVAGGIPGVPLRMGGARSGIVIALHLKPGQDDVLGHTIAHELGHYLGLFHTVEQPTATGSMIEDNLADTDDAATNLMHWSVSESATELSEDQRFVLRRSPWFAPPAR